MLIWIIVANYPLIFFKSLNIVFTGMRNACTNNADSGSGAIVEHEKTARYYSFHIDTD